MYIYALWFALSQFEDGLNIRGVTIKTVDLVVDPTDPTDPTDVENGRRRSFMPRFKLPSSYGNVISQRVCRKKRRNQFCWSPQFWDLSERTAYEELWENTESTTERQRVHVDRPIIHFRCGDVPISTFKEGQDHHSVYELACVDDIRKLVRYANATGPAWMIVGGHGGNRAECDILAETYARELNVTLLERASVETDYVWLKSAPLVVGVMSSSFLFASRLGKLNTLFMPEMLPNVFNTKWSPFTFQKCPTFYHEAPATA